MGSAVAGWFSAPALLFLVLSPITYWLVRRRGLRRLRIMKQPFPPSWEQILQNHIAFFRALPDPEKQRFRQMVKVFLDEVRITGIRTTVDDTVRVLVAASAAFRSSGFRIGNTIGWVRSLSIPTRLGRSINHQEALTKTFLAWSALNTSAV